MANPTIESADIYRVLMNVLKLLGIADPNYPTVPTVLASSPWTKKQILDYILQADLEVRIWIAETLNHPLRNALSWSVSATLADGDAVPPSNSGHRYVKITNTTTRQGKLAKTFEQLLRWKESPTIYGAYKWHFFIHNGHIHLIDATSTATMSLADLSINRTANTNDGSISSPVAYEWAVTANTMKMTAIHLRDATNAKLYTDLAFDYKNQAKAGALSLPPAEVFQRLGT